MRVPSMTRRERSTTSEHVGAEGQEEQKYDRAGRAVGVRCNRDRSEDSDSGKQNRKEEKEPFWVQFSTGIRAVLRLLVGTNFIVLLRCSPCTTGDRPARMNRSRGGTRAMGTVWPLAYTEWLRGFLGIGWAEPRWRGSWERD